MSQKDEASRENILAFVIQFKRIHDGMSPTFADICEGCSIASQSTVWYHLRELARTGRIILGGKAKARTIRVPGGEWIYRGQPPCQ